MFAIAAHLVYWGMATIIYPLCESNVYVVAPDSSTSMYVDSIWLVKYILFASSVARTCLFACVSACIRSFVRLVMLRYVCSFSQSVGRSVVPSVDRSFVRFVTLPYVRLVRSVVCSFGKSVDRSDVPSVDDSFVRSLRSFCLSFARWLCSFGRFFPAVDC